MIAKLTLWLVPKRGEDHNHRTALVTWLNKWGCRLAIQHLEATSVAIHDRFKQVNADQLLVSRAVWELTDNDISNAARAYGLLKDKVVAQRDQGTRVSNRKIGPTAASKILFALRPHALMPWDAAMRDDFDCYGSLKSYLKFQTEIRNIAWKIQDLCNINGFDISELPAQIERPDSTTLEIINEYIWIKVTKKCRLPDATILKRWTEWK